jgi:hypothetical protein
MNRNSAQELILLSQIIIFQVKTKCTIPLKLLQRTISFKLSIFQRKIRNTGTGTNQNSAQQLILLSK